MKFSGLDLIIVRLNGFDDKPMVDVVRPAEAVVSGFNDSWVSRE